MSNPETLTTLSVGIEEAADQIRFCISEIVANSDMPTVSEIEEHTALPKGVIALFVSEMVQDGALCERDGVLAVSDSDPEDGGSLSPAGYL